MAKKLTEKYNDSCIKLFEFLKMLYAGEVEFKKVIDHFSDGNYDGTSNTHVTLNKYLNAMKIFGIKVEKNNNKYKMLSSIDKLKLSPQDVKSIVLLEKAEQILPEGANKTNFEEFLKAVEQRFDENAKNMKPVFDNNKDVQLSLYHIQIAEQIRKCEKYCQDNQKLEITYKDYTGKEINIIGSPLEQIYNKRKICLKLLGNNGNRVYEIPIDTITNLKQLPSAASKKSIPLTVVYRIKNRLAQNYKLRDDERVGNIESDGSQVIINKNEDLNLLLSRLMRYGKDCEIISPKFLKDEMVDMINKTLSNYLY